MKKLHYGLSLNMSSHSGSSLKIGHKFSLTSSVVVVLAMCVFWLVTNYNTENILRQQADNLGESLARQTAILVTELVLSNDLISMNVLLNQLTRDAAIAQAAVLNVDDQVIAIAGTGISSGATNPQQFFGSYVAPIALQGSLAGYVRINLNQSYIEEGVTRNFNFMLIAMALLIVVAVTMTMALAQHFITFPLNSLATRMQQMRQGAIELSPFSERNDEVGFVIQEYNKLAHTLVRGAEGRPVLPDEFEQLLDSESGYDQDARSGVTFGSVLHIQISNYQELLRLSNGRDSISRINACYFYLSQVVELYNGNIETCTEDDIMISFGARQIDEEHAFHACCSALLFFNVMARLDSMQRKHGLPGFQFNAGLHSGDLLTGVLSPLGRNRYTIAGDTISIARRVSENAEKNNLILSEQALTHAGGDNQFSYEPFSEFFDHSIDQLVATYAIREAAPGLQSLLDNQAEHLLQVQ